MPIKEGPNGTWRSYSSSNGRYVKVSFDDLNARLETSKKKLSKEERRIRKTAYLRELALRSKDPGLYKVFDFLESRIPHYVQFVNEYIYVPSDKKTRETDLIGKNAIIEIKMGHKGKRIKQLLAQKEVADKRGLKIILYAPNLPYNARIEFEKRGIKTVKNTEELYLEVKK